MPRPALAHTLSRPARYLGLPAAPDAPAATAKALGLDIALMLRVAATELID